MNRIALVGWQPEGAGSHWADLLDELEKGVLKYPATALYRIRWPADGVCNLTSYQVLLFAYPVQKWFPRNLDPGWIELLSKSGHLIGKTAYAFSGTRRLGSEKTLVLLMNSLESEGLRVRDFSILCNSKDVAQALDRLQLMEKWAV